MQLQIDVDAEENLFQKVNLTIGPVSRKQFRKDRDGLLESTILHLFWVNKHILEAWAPSL